MNCWLHWSDWHRAAGLCVALWAALAPCASFAAPPLPALAAARTPPSAPPAPPTVSPVQYFRELLALNRVQREERLADKPERQRTLLLAKLEEYEALPSEERERRLRSAQLRYVMLRLMALAPEERSAHLETASSADRAVLEQRLHQWDLLPPHLQKEVLDNEWMVQYVLRFENASAEQTERMLSGLPAEYRGQIETSLQQWRALSPEKRQRIYGHCQQFFELPPKQRAKTLSVLDESDRRKLERTLGSLEALSPAERRESLEAFRKFAALGPEEREQFFQNLSRWQQMSEEEKSTWRNLVRALPPLPPGFVLPPPLPPGLDRQIK